MLCSKNSIQFTDWLGNASSDTPLDPGLHIRLLHISQRICYLGSGCFFSMRTGGKYEAESLDYEETRNEHVDLDLCGRRESSRHPAMGAKRG